MSEERSFEAAQGELEQIVQRLESGQAELDEALALWERGEELYRICLAKLDAAQGKIEELARRAEAAQDSQPASQAADSGIESRAWQAPPGS